MEKEKSKLSNLRRGVYVFIVLMTFFSQWCVSMADIPIAVIGCFSMYKVHGSGRVVVVERMNASIRGL